MDNENKCSTTHFLTQVGGDLRLQGNQVRRLPETFGNIQVRGGLFLSFNQLRTLPETFGNIQVLGDLSLYSNELNALPETFGNIKVGGDQVALTITITLTITLIRLEAICTWVPINCRHYRRRSRTLRLGGKLISAAGSILVLVAVFFFPLCL